MQSVERLLEVKRNEVLKHEFCTSHPLIPPQRTAHRYYPLPLIHPCCVRAAVVLRCAVGWVALEFDLSVSPRSLLPHFQQLLQRSDTHVAAQYQQLEWSTLVT